MAGSAVGALRDSWKILLVAALCAITLIPCAVLHFQKQHEMSAMMTGGYGAQMAVYGGGKHNKSWFDGRTVTVLKDGERYICRHVHDEDLRQLKPINCNDGKTLHAR